MVINVLDSSDRIAASIKTDKLSAIIEKHAKKSGVRRIAVENFLGSIDTKMSQSDHLRNLNADARDYKWNAATQAAIRAGLKEIYNAGL